MKYTGSISLFPKSIISTFVKRCIQKYMHECYTNSIVHLALGEKSVFPKMETCWKPLGIVTSEVSP